MQRHTPTLFQAALQWVQVWVASKDRDATWSVQASYVASILFTCARVLPGVKAVGMHQHQDRAATTALGTMTDQLR
eukprot:CAMPEP_0119105774 /NCGR_PEP_ID=MMETSP1180-20130426/3647_1 /TAXON_ID=3052 ORGANISM="Chlamydomonas cf sp, Strain CCMP681" /NCGR_SAMPLE_ID=MMETSP1180 /ASSEMBLY_ACC=CAM_ASM_000741 /LENGTH=75 /DNA_ID=CAMNT_0007090913 /DNA_START=63 /DNA_END=287 /DNA_ORIENTATION=+